MKKIQDASHEDVWQHWMRVEKSADPNFRSDIREPLPKDLTWCLAEIEGGDVDKMFIISSSDWADISGSSFRVSDVASRLNNVSSNKESQRIATDINKKLAYLADGHELDTKLIAVTHDDSLIGPFTFIEGNRRSVVFTINKSMVGKQIFVGVSSKITEYIWAKKTYPT